MPKKVSRRSFLKRGFGSILAAIGLTSGGYFYAKNIEPKFLQINHKLISHSNIPESFNGLKIVQFSDTHLGFQYNLQQLQGLVRKINDFKPDVIIFTGDLIDEPNRYEETKQIVPLLNQLTAKFGKFAVYGNHDHGGYGSDIYRNIMENSGFRLLLNEAEEIRINQESIFMVGIDDRMLGKPNIQQSLQNIPEHAYKILLSHAPDVADEAAPYGIQLQLSGHSHGGQIQIPFLGVLVKPPFAQNYYEGMYTIGEQQSLTLYVNRGLGTTRLPFRFLSRPELTIFTLRQN